LNPARYAHTWDTGTYSLRNIDPWGDQTGHRGPSRLRSTPPSSRLGHQFAYQLSSLPEVKAFCLWAEANHIRVLATFPNLLDDPSYHTPEAKEGIQILERFFGRLSVPVIGQYDDSLLPKDQFLDTIYHLTEEAARTRTQKLAAKLKSYIR
jgi:hypothetical protein